jgi:predicted TIM-barrel fold metal-dependent hydrolase
MGALSLLPAASWAAEDSAPLYDTHVHLFTPDMQRYPIDLSGGVPEVARVLKGEIIAAPHTPDVVLQAWADNGVAGGVAVQFYSAYLNDNSFLLDSADAHRDKIAACVIFNATDPSTPAALKAAARTHGVTGLRLTGYPDAQGNYPWLDSDPAQATWAVADQLGLAVVVMYPPGKPTAAAFAHLNVLARRYPHVRLILDHFGWPVFVGAPSYGLSDAFEPLKGLPNLYYKFTTTNIDALAKAQVAPEDFLRHAVDVVGADRIMWGSSFGAAAPPYADLVKRIRLAVVKLTPAERRAVLHDTGQAMFGRKA